MVPIPLSPPPHLLPSSPILQPSTHPLTLSPFSSPRFRFLPLIPFTHSPIPYTASSVAAGETTSRSLLEILETHLSSSSEENDDDDHREFLVGERITAADVMVAMYVARGMEWVLRREWREGHPGVMGHWGRVGEWEAVKEVLGRRAGWVVCEGEEEMVEGGQVG